MTELIIAEKPSVAQKIAGAISGGKAKKENFWKALFRPKNSKLPDKMIDYERLQEFFKETRRS